MEVIIKLTNEKAGHAKYFLRMRYGKRVNTKLSTLIVLAINEAIRDEATKHLESHGIYLGKGSGYT